MWSGNSNYIAAWCSSDHVVGGFSSQMKVLSVKDGKEYIYEVMPL